MRWNGCKGSPCVWRKQKQKKMLSLACTTAAGAMCLPIFLAAEHEWMANTHRLFKFSSSLCQRMLSLGVKELIFHDAHFDLFARLI
jgi:hypothetical protein